MVGLWEAHLSRLPASYLATRPSSRASARRPTIFSPLARPSGLQRGKRRAESRAHGPLSLRCHVAQSPLSRRPRWAVSPVVTTSGLPRQWLPPQPRPPRLGLLPAAAAPPPARPRPPAAPREVDAAAPPAPACRNSREPPAAMASAAPALQSWVSSYGHGGLRVALRAPAWPAVRHTADMASKNFACMARAATVSASEALGARHAQGGRTGWRAAHAASRTRAPRWAAGC